MLIEHLIGDYAEIEIDKPEGWKYYRAHIWLRESIGTSRSGENRGALIRRYALSHAECRKNAIRAANWLVYKWLPYVCGDSALLPDE